jgi:hypothetical protein
MSINPDVLSKPGYGTCWSHQHGHPHQTQTPAPKRPTHSGDMAAATTRRERLHRSDIGWDRRMPVHFCGAR